MQSGWVTARFNKVKEGRVRKNLEEAFEAVRQLVQRPEELEAMPDESVIVPVSMALRKKK